MRTAFPLACREKRSFQNGTGVASGPFAADPLDAGPRTILMTRNCDEPWRHWAGGGSRGTPPVGVSRQIILFLGGVLRNHISLEKQGVIGDHSPPFQGETAHTLSTQLPAKPLSTKTLVACGGYVNAPTRLTYYEKNTSRVTFAVVPYGCFGLLRFG